VITRHALQDETFSGIVGLRTAQIPGISLYNTNELLDLYPGANGVKTGYTGQAGRCLVASATREGRRLISVVLNSPTRSARARSSKSILDYAFDNYKPYILVGAGENVGNLKVKKGITAEIPLKAAEEIKLPMRQDEIVNLAREYSFPETLEAPVKAGISVGTAKFILGGKVIASTTILTGEQSLRKEFHYYIGNILKHWMRLVKI
jgi:D-alanyl-D-alanine carboxypeptidase (penicillin-binding protein 5/6)